jgi:lipocalin
MLRTAVASVIFGFFVSLKVFAKDGQISWAIVASPPRCYGHPADCRGSEETEEYH